MAYRNDPELEFIGQMRSEDLSALVHCLTRDKDGDLRLTEELSMNDKYKEFYPDHSKYWQEIAAELQCYGGNTFATLFRGGKGVPYLELLMDVCDKLKVNYNKNSSVERIEQSMLMKVLEDALEKMSPQELKELATELGVDNTNGITPQILLGSFQAIFKAGGFKSYQLTVSVANAIWRFIFGKGLTFAGNATLTKAMSVLAGPIGFAIAGTWTAIDIASTAYRVTIPACIQVAALRQQYMQQCRERSGAAA